MNHFHEILEGINNKLPYIQCTASFSDKDWNMMENDIKTYCSKAICFNMGDMSGLANLKSIRDICKLPFDTCWFESNFEHEKLGYTAGCLVSRTPDYILIYLWRKKLGNWLLKNAMQIYVNDLDYSGATTKVYAVDDVDYTLEIEEWLLAVQIFLTAMNCKNVEKVEHKPTPKLQKARLKKGKQPLFSYWTLELKPQNDSKNALGGTHASPRVHLRRGHPRQYKIGEWTWVQPCMVGNKKLGMVHKDYDGSKLHKNIEPKKDITCQSG